MPDLTPRDLDAKQQKPRKNGTLPLLPDNGDVELLRAFLTRAFRPIEQGWHFQIFERAGRDKLDPCSIVFANGRESRTFRFKQQRELMSTPRPAVIAISDGWLAMPHLTGTEIEDVWAALCTLGRVLTEQDETAQTRDWLEQMLPSTLPLTGYSLVPDARHDALMAIKAAGQFVKSDALALIRGGDEQRYQQRPCRVIDAQTGEQWLRAGETATFVRWVVGVEPLSVSTLKARLHEIGVIAKHFEDYRPPHPKLELYQLTEQLVEFVDGGN